MDIENDPSEPNVEGEILPEMVATVEEAVTEPGDSSNEPIVGMEFANEEDAYTFYNNYAFKNGFSIRKNLVKRRGDGSLKSKTFCCSKEGSRKSHSKYVTIKPQANYRCNCKARVDFKINTNSTWVIRFVELSHNHTMTSPDKVHILRSHRRILPHQKDLIDHMSRSGMKPNQIYNFLQSGASNSQHIGFIRRDSNNFISSMRRQRLDAKESQGLLQYLKNRQTDDPSFFYAIQVHESGELANFFWADGKSITDYLYFGDVISFDTTFSTNQYDMPFAPIIGINHHKQTILFGAALLYDETADSFIWLFETFMAAVHQKQPSTIFTDQSAAIAKAIEAVMPTSSHRLCLWHIYQNAAINLSHVISNIPTFLPQLKACIYERSSVDRFEEMWSSLMEKYNLADNSWLQKFYKIREKWATVYRVDSFCADMTTTQRSESMNSAFKKFFRRKLNMFDFIEQYDTTVNFFREKELLADYKCRHSTPSMRSVSMPMLKQAALRYTNVIFTEFEEQYLLQLTCSCERVHCDEVEETYKVGCVDGTCYLVSYKADTRSVDCSCKMFVCGGILCMHALKVLGYKNIYELPDQYVLKRWTKYAKEGVSFNSKPVHLDSSGKEPLVSLYRRVCQKAFVQCSKSMNSRQGLMYLEKGLDELAPGIDNAIRTDNEIASAEIEPSCSNNVVPETCNVTIRPPQVQNRKKQKRHKSVLERSRRKTNPSADTFTEPRHNIQSPESTMVGGSFMQLLASQSPNCTPQSLHRRLDFDDIAD